MSGCSGCNKRREMIKKWFAKGNKKVALLFSGGVDSTYCAIKLKEQGYNVHLLHVAVTHVSGYDMSGEAIQCRKIAEALGLPFKIMATIKLPHASKGGGKSHSYKNRFSLAANLAMCYPDEEYAYFATGTSPSIDASDRETDGILKEMVKACVPYAKLLYPRDGMTRAQQAKSIPDNIKALLTSCTFGKNGARCGTCDKCIEDKTWN